MRYVLAPFSLQFLPGFLAPPFFLVPAVPRHKVSTRDGRETRKGLLAPRGYATREAERTGECVGAHWLGHTLAPTRRYPGSPRLTFAASSFAVARTARRLPASAHKTHRLFVFGKRRGYGFAVTLHDGDGVRLRDARTQDAMRATRSSLKEWPLRDGPRPPGVGGKERRPRRGRGDARELDSTRVDSSRVVARRGELRWGVTKGCGGGERGYWSLYSGCTIGL